MPQIINAFSGNQSVTDNLKSIGNSMFANQAQQEYLRQSAAAKARENAAAPALADAIRQNRASEILAQTAQGWGPAGAPGALQYYRGAAAVNANGNIDDAPLNTAMLANTDVASTPAGQHRANANLVQREGMQIAEKAREFNETPQPVRGADGLPAYATTATAPGQGMPLTTQNVEGAVTARDYGLLPEQPGRMAGTPGAASTPGGLGNPVAIPPPQPGVSIVATRNEAGKKIADENAAATEKSLGAIDFLSQAEDAKTAMKNMPDSVFGPRSGAINTARSIVGMIPGDPAGVHPAMADYSFRQGILNNLAAAKFREKFGSRPTQVEYLKMLETVGGLNAPDAQTVGKQLDHYARESYTALQNGVQRGVIRPDAVPPALVQRGIQMGALDPRFFPGTSPDAAGATPTSAALTQTPSVMHYDAKGNRVQ